MAVSKTLAPGLSQRCILTVSHVSSARRLHLRHLCHLCVTCSLPRKTQRTCASCIPCSPGRQGLRYRLCSRLRPAARPASDCISRRPLHTEKPLVDIFEQAYVVESVVAARMERLAGSHVRNEVLR